MASPFDQHSPTSDKPLLLALPPDRRPPPYRAGSLPCHRVLWSPPANFRQRIYILAEAQRRSRESHRPGQRWDFLTPKFIDVLDALLTFLHPATGACYPSYETLAKRAGCHPDTVCEAIKALRELNVITWLRRRWFNGQHWQQTSNGYRFLIAPPLLNPWQAPIVIKYIEPKRKSALETALASLQRAISERLSPHDTC